MFRSHTQTQHSEESFASSFHSMVIIDTFHTMYFSLKGAHLVDMRSVLILANLRMKRRIGERVRVVSVSE